MSRLVVLRPEPGASATVARARERGFDASSVPLFELEPLDWDPPEPNQFDGILLTSANSVLYAGEQLQRYRGLRVYAVGQATADAARRSGFDVAATGSSGVDRLLSSIDADLRLLHLCGEYRRAPPHQQRIDAVAVYRSTETKHPKLPEAASMIALVHSPRAAHRLAQLVKERGLVSVAAISAMAGEAAGEGWRSVAIAKQPTDDALLAVAAMLCKNPNLQ